MVGFVLNIASKGQGCAFETGIFSYIRRVSASVAQLVRAHGCYKADHREVAGPTPAGSAQYFLLKVRFTCYILEMPCVCEVGSQDSYVVMFLPT